MRNLPLLLPLALAALTVRGEGVGPHRPLTVAVVAVEADVPDRPGLRESVGAMLAETLSQAEGVELVERQRMDAILKEHNLQSSGLVRPESAQKAGRLLGASHLVHCRLYQVGDQLWASARLLDAETAKARVVLVKSPAGGTTEKLLDDLAARILACIRKQAAASAGGTAAVGGRRKEWKGSVRPVVAVALANDVKWDERAVASLKTVLAMNLSREGLAVRVVLSKQEAAWIQQCVKKPLPGPVGSDLSWLLIARVKTEALGRKGDQVRSATQLELHVIDRKNGGRIAESRASASGMEATETSSVLVATEKAAADAVSRLCSKLRGME